MRKHEILDEERKIGYKRDFFLLIWLIGQNLIWKIVKIVKVNNLSICKVLKKEIY